jgi:hypothetical protein
LHSLVWAAVLGWSLLARVLHIHAGRGRDALLEVLRLPYR